MHVFIHELVLEDVLTNMCYVLQIVFFRLNRFLAGGLVPWTFHAVNIVLHACVSVVMIRVFSVLFAGHVTDATTGARVFGAPRASFISAALFAVHPIHTESVSTRRMG
jgi:hypothetical protein